MTSPKQPFNHKEMKRKLNRNVAVPFLQVTKDQGRTEEITAATWKRRIFRKVSRMVFGILGRLFNMEARRRRFLEIIIFRFHVKF